MNTVNDKVIVITGGSSGIGAAAARTLSGIGAKVVITGRSAATRLRLFSGGLHPPE